MHTICLWKWKQENSAHAYTAEHVNAMARMLRKHIQLVRYRIVCITDDPAGITECATFPLWKDAAMVDNASGRHLSSCYRRLRLYDPQIQSKLGIKRGDRVVSIDLDTLVVGSLDTILSTTGLYVGWELRGTYHPKVFNGSFQMFTAGELDYIWLDFDPSRSPYVASDAGYKGSDQAWLSYNLARNPYSVSIKYPEFSSYPLNNRISGQVDFRTRLIFFHGSQKPWYESTLAASPFVERHWNAARSEIHDASPTV